MAEPDTVRQFRNAAQSSGRRERPGLAAAMLAVLVVASVLITASPALAGSGTATTVAPLPSAVVESTGGGEPFGGATGLAALAGGSLDLAEHGYVEEEYFVSGTGNVYQYGTGDVEIRTANVPYTTRILVHRPINPRKFSGNVWLETSHPQRAYDAIWLQIPDYIIDNGDAHVSVTTRRTSGGSSAIDALKGSDPERYAAIDFRDDGLNWDVISQVGRLLRTRDSMNPLHDYDIEHVYAQGWSGAGALLLAYISDGFHDRLRLPDGDPVFDAFLVGEPSGYPQINATTPAIPTSDSRQQVQPVDVPVITLHTRPQEQYRRRDDATRPGDRYRVYEVPGAAHAEIRLPSIWEQTDDVFANGGPLGCAYELSQFPMHHYFKSTLARLDGWASRGVKPPASRRMELNADGTAVLDEHGNPIGGVRSTYLDVPYARYFDNSAGPGGIGSGCVQVGAQERFSDEQLAALYPSAAEYRRKIDRRVGVLVRQGWLLPADATQVRREAKQFELGA